MITPEQSDAFYEAKGRALGEMDDPPERCCLHCLEVYNALEEQCPCEPVETGVEEWDIWGDR